VSGSDSSTAAYGLHNPTFADFRDAVHRVHGTDGPVVWSRLLATSGLSAGETDAKVLPRLLAVMAVADPVTQLCAQALRIRQASHTHLSAAHAITRS
jgi:hypothetical protein